MNQEIEKQIGIYTERLNNLKKDRDSFDGDKFRLMDEEENSYQEQIRMTAEFIHVLKKVGQTEKESGHMNPSKNNINSPLKLSWNETVSQYKVNKSLDQSGEYVDKAVADKLLEGCKWAKGVIKRLADEGRYPEFLLAQNGGNGIMPLVDAIKQATEPYSPPVKAIN